MNEELQKALATLLAKTTSAAEAGVSFLQAELPEVIRQLLMWKAIESAAHMVVLIGLTWLCVYAARRAWTYGRDEGSGVEAFAMIPAMAAGLSGYLAIRQIDWLQIIVAPKVYLIEYAASLAK